MQRRELLLLLGAAGLTWTAEGRAQHRAMPVIGFLHSGLPAPADATVAAFRKSLSESGYAVGENVAIEYRWAEGHFDRLPALVADLVAHKVDLIVASGGTPPVLAAKAATGTIPIVFVNVGDPVGQGLVVSLARPGGNLTGISILFPELTLKRIELIADLVPDAKVIGLLVNPKNPINETTVGHPQEAGRAKGVRLSILKAGSASEIDDAFTSLPRVQADALVVGADPLFATRRAQVVALASRQRVPAMYAWREFVTGGGLVSYGPALTDTYRQAGVLAAKILKGANPADLPVQQPTKFELVINLKTAKALGLTVPQTILARADEVIE